MRVSIDHSEEQTGLLRKTTHYQVSASIKFSEEEIAIIKGLHLQDHVVVERNATSTVKDADDLDIWNLTVGKLVRAHEKNEPDNHCFRTPHEARDYESVLKESLVNLKNYLEENKNFDQTHTSFEL